MSIETWKAEFYPVTAQEIVAEGATELELVQHSLLKWEGLRKENLDRHGLVIVASGDLVSAEPVKEQSADDEDVDAYVFVVGSTSCALCEEYYDNDSEYNPCDTCPLARARATDESGVPVACDRVRPDEAMAPWQAYLFRRDPEDMIYWLQRAEAFCLP